MLDYRKDKEKDISYIGDNYPGYAVAASGKVYEDIGGGEMAEVSRMKYRGKWCVKLKSAKKKWQIIPVQRLVAQHFLKEPPDGYYKILHADGDIANCAATNLLYEDLSQGRYGDENGRSLLTMANATDIRKAHNKGESIRSLAKRYGVQYYTVHCIVNNKTWVEK